MELKIVLTGETPSKKNSRINTRSGRSFPSKKYSGWHKTAKMQVLAQTVPEQFGFGLVLSIRFVHGDLRRRDSDNMVSSILDLLVDSNVLLDDNWQIVNRIEVDNSYEKGNPHCLITLKSI